MNAALASQTAMPAESGVDIPRVTPAAAAAPTIPPPSQPATPYLETLAAQFPQLEILEHLGQGGMGVVYKARQRQLDRLVAVKILPSIFGQDAAFAERFMREARALAKLNHPNIVQVYDFGRTDEHFYFIMEFVDGANLRALICDKRLKPEVALTIVPQICQALQFAHDEGIVHRDIKPENILLDKKGRVKIADFGLAKLMGQQGNDLTLTGTHHVMGTLNYMAPEQMQGSRAIDHRADIYSLGVVFYEMLTGQLPIGRFEPPSKKVQMDVRLDEVVLRSLESEPDLRYQHASEVKTDLETIAGDVAPSKTASLPSRTGMPSHSATAEIQRRVAWPANGLLITGIIDCATVPLGLIIALILSFTAGPGRGGVGPFELLVGMMETVLSVVFGIPIVIGALKMKHVESRRFAIASSILAMVPRFSPAWFLGIPMEIWSLMVLSRPEVKAAFDSGRHEARGQNKEPGPPAARPALDWICAIGSISLFAIGLVGPAILIRAHKPLAPIVFTFVVGQVGAVVLGIFGRRVMKLAVPIALVVVGGLLILAPVVGHVYENTEIRQMLVDVQKQTDVPGFIHHPPGLVHPGVVSSAFELTKFDTYDYLCFWTGALMIVVGIYRTRSGQALKQ